MTEPRLGYFQNSRIPDRARQVRGHEFELGCSCPPVPLGTVIPPLRNENAGNCEIPCAEWRDLLFVAISRTADPSGQKAPRGMTVPRNAGNSNSETALSAN